MIIGALMDAGLDPIFLEKELKKLKLSGYKLIIEKTPHGIQMDAKLSGNRTRRTFKEIIEIIDRSTLDRDTKENSKKIFRRLAQAEAKFHKLPIHKLHLHELSSTDTIIDIIGTCIGLKKLGIKEVYFSPINLGSGFVKFSHGVYPVPAPAVKELVKGYKVYSSDIKKELTTPTGAAIITAIGRQLNTLPYLKLERIGCGEGSYKLKEPDILKVFIGEKVFIPGKESVYVMETTIDDMNPEFYEYVIQKLIKAGALDAYVLPIIMKKNRPGALLTVLSRKNNLSKLSEIIFKETTTFGLRIYEGARQTLERKVKKIETKFGVIKIKIGYLNGNAITLSPEYEDCKLVAEKCGRPLKDIYEAVKLASTFNARPQLRT